MNLTDLSTRQWPSVANFWRAAAPEEMEANIIEPQENVLRNAPGVSNLNSFIGRGSGFVNLSFVAGKRQVPCRCRFACCAIIRIASWPRTRN
jgi:hypothetical protein